MYTIRYEDETFALWLTPEGVEIGVWEDKEPIFVCGRLMEPSFLASVIGREVAMAPAVALGCSRSWEDFEGKPYIFLVKGGKGFVPGTALLGITKEERTKLHAFEEIERVRKIEPVVLRIGEREVKGVSFFKR